MSNPKPVTPVVESVNIPQDPWAYVYAAATFGLIAAAVLGFVVPMFF